VHAGAIAPAVNVVREVDPGRPKDDSVQLDLTARDDGLPPRPDVVVLEDRFASDSVDSELAVWTALQDWSIPALEK
jgi:hypothetical protein